METLELWDRELFVWLNSLHAPAVDPLMEGISGKLTWIPLYALILFGIGKIRGWKSLLVVVPLAALLVVLTDLGSVWMKEYFMRYRPCKNLELAASIHNPLGCGGWYGFVSSHASNVFGIALFCGLLLRKRWMLFALLAWAALVGYSRIYLGKHYPADVIGGALYGIACGWIVMRLYGMLGKRFLEKRNPLPWESET